MKRIRVGCALLANEPGEVREGRLARGIALLEEAGKRRADIAVLPEAFADPAGQCSYEPIDGAIVTAVRAAAKTNSMITVAPMGELESDGTKRNTAVVIGREGEVIAKYSKNIPFWGEVGVTPGRECRVFETDACRFGVLICFESQWPDMWMAMGELQAEVVIWPSAYSGGRKLAAPAIYNNFYVVSCTRTPDTTLVDISGEEMCYARGGDQVVIHEVDVDRTMVHDNYNGEALARLRSDLGERVRMRYFEKEGWWLVESADPEVSVRALLKEQKIETLREYTQRSRREIYALRAAGQAMPESQGRRE